MKLFILSLLLKFLESLNILVAYSQNSAPHMLEFFASKYLRMQDFYIEHLLIPYFLDNSHFLSQKFQDKIDKYQIQIILDITFNQILSQRLSFVQCSCIHAVAYRVERQFLQNNSYLIMPSYQQEGQALKALFQELKFRKISYINQQEKGFYKPLEFMEQSNLNYVSTSINIPLNSQLGLNFSQCNSSYYKQRVQNEILKAIRIYGSPVIFMSADICWQAFILQFTALYKMTGDQYAWIVGLESSNIINQQVIQVIQNQFQQKSGILDNGMIALTPLGFIPQNYLELTLFYVQRFLRFIESNLQTKEKNQENFIQIFQSSQFQFFDFKRQIKSQFSVFNTQNQQQIEVYQIKDSKAFKKNQVIFPGPSIYPPADLVQIEFSYSTNDNEPFNFSSFDSLTIPPLIIPCMVDYINKDQNLLSNQLLKSNPVSYGGAYFNLNNTLEAFMQEQENLGIAHIASILTISWYSTFQFLNSINIDIPYLYASREDFLQNSSTFPNAINNYVSQEIFGDLHIKFLEKNK